MTDRQVVNFGRVAGYGAWPAKISKLALSQTVTVSGNVAVTSPGVLAGATVYSVQLAPPCLRQTA